MFTGIVQDVGCVISLEQRGGDVRLRVGVERLDLTHATLGDSISVAGVCLTVVEFGAKHFSADVSRETLSMTTIGAWNVGRRVNLEPALRAGDALGGHLVSGHIDGLAEVQGREGDARSLRLQFSTLPTLSRYIARKGSVALDGVSLTVNGVSDDAFDINLIPHTLSVTTLGELKPGDRVNLEVDQMARYVERLAQSFSGANL